MLLEGGGGGIRSGRRPGTATAFSLHPASQWNNFASTSNCLYFSTAIPLFLSSLPPTISSILPRHTVHRLLFSRPPRAHVRFSPRRYQLIRPLRPSSTAVRSPLARRYYRPKLRFETLRFHFARIGLDVREESMQPTSCGYLDFRLLDFGQGLTNEYSFVSFFIFSFLDIENEFDLERNLEPSSLNIIFQSSRWIVICERWRNIRTNIFNKLFKEKSMFEDLFLRFYFSNFNVKLRIVEWGISDRNIFRRFSINNKHTLDWLAIQPILPISGAVHLLDLVPPGS